MSQLTCGQQLWPRCDSNNWIYDCITSTLLWQCIYSMFHSYCLNIPTNATWHDSLYCFARRVSLTHVTVTVRYVTSVHPAPTCSAAHPPCKLFTTIFDETIQTGFIFFRDKNDAESISSRADFAFILCTSTKLLVDREWSTVNLKSNIKCK